VNDQIDQEFRAAMEDLRRQMLAEMGISAWQMHLFEKMSRNYGVDEQEVSVAEQEPDVPPFEW
jgi:hypothetical protein